MGPKASGEIYLEFIADGAYVKVTAIEADSGLEVSIVGPRDAPRAQLEKLAIQKLNYMRSKEPQPPKEPGGRGKIV